MGGGRLALFSRRRKCRRCCAFLEIDLVLVVQVRSSVMCTPRKWGCQDSILLSGCGNMSLLFATSSYSWILCLKLFAVMCCLPAAKTVGQRKTEVVAQNHGKCPRATYFMPKKSELSETDVRDLGNLQCCAFPGSASKNPPPQDEM